MDESQLISIKLECLRLALATNGGYSMNDGVTQISSEVKQSDKIVDDAQKYFDFIFPKT